MSWARLTDGTGWSYRLTDEDFDTAVRVVYGEVGTSGLPWEPYAHLWAILHRQYARRFSSWAAAARSYSSPVNPDVPLTERRRQIRAMALSDFPQAIRDQVAAWFQGRVGTNVGGVELRRVFDFGACAESSAIPHGVPDLTGAAGQCYWNAPSAHVVDKVVFVGGSASLRIWPWVVGGLLAVALTGTVVAVVLSRRRRRQLGSWS